MNIFKLIFILGIFNAFFFKAQTHRFFTTFLSKQILYQMIIQKRYLSWI